MAAHVCSHLSVLTERLQAAGGDDVCLRSPLTGCSIWVYREMITQFIPPSPQILKPLCVGCKSVIAFAKHLAKFSVLRSVNSKKFLVEITDSYN